MKKKPPQWPIFASTATSSPPITDPVVDRLSALRDLYPEAFTEGLLYLEKLRAEVAALAAKRRG